MQNVSGPFGTNQPYYSPEVENQEYDRNLSSFSSSQFDTQPIVNNYNNEKQENKQEASTLSYIQEDSAESGSLEDENALEQTIQESTENSNDEFIQVFSNSEFQLTEEEIKKFQKNVTINENYRSNRRTKEPAIELKEDKNQQLKKSEKVLDFSKNPQKK